ncbi:hypothetical protein F0562_010909 [Nyssa sinensis]|uniref:Disease resistance R13L4/SHOC-2-like LRR domain-containing protein n=1 Tax=Nyssa sinensis TaxID=561372 RepID=A0A5J5A332_9ASTE|nr:hypothetical protein F0562_010909 [Nyssa sinensis]
MPIRSKRTPVDTIPSMLERVAQIIQSATGQPNEIQRDDDSLVSLQNIESELKEMEELFPQFKRCEEVLITEFNFLKQDIDDDVFENFTNRDKIGDKLKSIEVRIGKIKGIFPQINLPPLDETAAQSQQRALSEDQSRNVSDDWLRLSVEENILVSPSMANLQLSYDVLDNKLKICLFCLAVFPEKAVIKKRPLIYWWIAEGLVNKSNLQEGERIFNDLIAKVVTRAEFFDFDPTGKIVDIFSRSRRACLVSGNKAFSDNNTNSGEDELVTIFNVNWKILSFNADLFLKLKKLVVLQLGRWKTSARYHIEVEKEEFLNELGALKHLKYLSLRGISRITALHPSVVECINLEILDLRACHNLETLPSDISSLRKLAHLDVSECYLLESMPKGLEKLTSLQVLKGFVSGHSRKSPCKLGDLVHLKKLRKLSIHIASESLIDEGELKKVKEIESLRILTISWGGVALSSKSSTEANSNVGGSLRKEGAKLTRTATLTVKSFTFPPKLEKLDLRCIPMSPDWLKPSILGALKKLYIRGGQLENLAHESDKKWEVETLRLKYLKNLKIEASYLQQDFPKLTYFEKVRCHQIAESQYENDVEWERNEGWEALKSKLPSN